MGKVFTHMTMSLDGYIAAPDDQPGELFDWYGAGEVSVPSGNENIAFDVDEASAEMLRELTENVGALVSGRRLFDIADGWNDSPPGRRACRRRHSQRARERRRALAEHDLRRRSRGCDRQGARDRRRPGRHSRQRQRHPAGTRPWPGGRGKRQPRAGPVRRGDPLLLQARPRTPAARRPGRGAGTPRPPPQVSGPSLTAPHVCEAGAAGQPGRTLPAIKGDK